MVITFFWSRITKKTNFFPSMQMTDHMITYVISTNVSRQKKNVFIAFCIVANRLKVSKPLSHIWHQLWMFTLLFFCEIFSIYKFLGSLFLSAPLRLQEGELCCTVVWFIGIRKAYKWRHSTALSTLQSMTLFQINTVNYWRHEVGVCQMKCIEENSVPLGYQ